MADNYRSGPGGNNIRSLTQFLVSRFFLHGVVLLSLLAIGWVSHNQIRSLWWMGDDPMILWSVVDQGVFSHFYRPEIWQSFSGSNLTPWVQLSFGIDWNFFGLDPKGYYGHHLISFFLVILAAYWILVDRFPPILTAWILALFILSVPSTNILRYLMTRHYLEGLFLSLAACHGYIASIRSNRMIWSVIGALLYLGAVTAKEIYVPLVMILPFMSPPPFQKKMKMLAPFLAVTCLYIGWRSYMLHVDHMLAGYLHIRFPGWRDLFRFPAAAAEIMGWNQNWQKAVFLAAGIIAFCRYRTSLPSYATFGLWLVVLLGPIWPVINQLDARYLFVPAFMVFVWCGHAVMALWNQKENSVPWKIAALCLAGCLLLAVSRPIFPFSSPAYVLSADRYEKEGKFVTYHPDEPILLIHPIGPSWYYYGLKLLRQRVLQTSAGPGVCFDLHFCDTLPYRQMVQYRDGDLIEVEWEEVQQNLPPGKPSADLSVEMEYIPGKLIWKFAPYPNGYRLLTIDPASRIYGYPIVLSALGELPLRFQHRFDFVIQYISPEGWVTLSPPFTIDPETTADSKPVRIHWKRSERAQGGNLGAGTGYGND